MNGAHYPKAPILEAVIGVQLQDQLSVRELDRIRNRFKKKYPFSQTQSNVSLAVTESGAATATSELLGHVLRDGNGADFVVVQLRNFSSGRAAPYETWEAMYSKAERDWDVLQKITGAVSIRRVGTRFINRVDVPGPLVREFGIEALLNLSIPKPKGENDHLSSFGLMSSYRHTETGAEIILNCSTAPPALLGHTSIMLDVDVSFECQDRIGSETFKGHCSDLRAIKNELFESFLTDSIRELFK